MQWCWIKMRERSCALKRGEESTKNEDIWYSEKRSLRLERARCFFTTFKPGELRGSLHALVPPLVDSSTDVSS
jgi:hypothetical protein